MNMGDRHGNWDDEPPLDTLVVLRDPRPYESPDPLVRALTDLVDAAPRVDWLTFGQRRAEAERLAQELQAAGWMFHHGTEYAPAATQEDLEFDAAR